MPSTQDKHDDLADAEVTPKPSKIAQVRRSTRNASKKSALLKPQQDAPQFKKRSGKESSDQQQAFTDDVFGSNAGPLPDSREPMWKSVWQSAKSSNLFAFLNAMKIPSIPIQIPSAISSRISTSTRGLTKSDLHRRGSQIELRKVVPFAPMLDQLLPDVQNFLARAPFDPKAWWLNKVIPDLTASHLPRQIFTEHDTEDYIWAVIIRPVLAIIHYCLYRDEDHDFPGASSIGGSAPVPDGILFGESIQDVLATFEFKNPKVLDHTLDELSQLLRTWEKMKLGRAAKFNWPNRTKGLNKTTKVLCQVWSQMDARKVSYGLLSSYERTYFLVRTDENPDTLYISRGYRHDEGLLLVTFAFIALALGCLQTKRLLLPNVDISHWEGLGVDEKKDTKMPGLVGLTLAPFVPGINDIVIDREEVFKWVDKD